MTSMVSQSVFDDALAHFCMGPSGEPCGFAAEPIVRCNDPEFGEMSVIRCKSCGHGVTTPYIPDVAVLYEGRETQDYQVQDNSIATAIKQFAFRRQTRKMLGQAGFSGGKIVDFGIGSGLYTSCIAASAGADAQVTGLDFFAEPPAQIGSAQYHSFADAHELEGSADLVTCFHVLEHDSDPQNILSQLRRLGKPGATFVIEVPHIDCPWRHVFGRHWDNWYLPFHRTHFSRTSFHRAVEQAGLTIVAEHPMHIPAIGRSIANMLGAQNSLPFVLMGAASFPLQTAVEKLANGPSALRIVAKS
ncbi:MAG: class I SAM-dependent methyltransferase [Pseudomonadota bacterium]